MGAGALVGLVSIVCVSAGAAEPQKKPAAPLIVTVSFSKKQPTLTEVNDGDFKVTVTLENKTKKDITIWPYLTVRLLDAKGKDVEDALALGRWGLIQTDSVIESVPFASLKAGKKYQLRFGLNSQMYDPDIIRGWKLPSAGEYKLVIHYRYNRADAKKKYGQGASNLDKTDKPWNKAVEFEKKVEVKLTVKED
jgi:hypothetical protein